MEELEHGRWRMEENGRWRMEENGRWCMVAGEW